MKTTLLRFFFPLLISIPVYTHSQDVYRTVAGDIAISITNNDSILLMVSNDLLVTLDYETSKISFTVPFETFKTGIDSFDTRLNSLRGVTIDFTGKLGITINSRRYDLQKYNLEGNITSANPPLSVRGNGSMTCIPAGDRLTPSCTLLVTIETTLAALHLEDVFKTADKGVRIDIRQSILEREKQ